MIFRADYLPWKIGLGSFVLGTPTVVSGTLSPEFQVTIFL